MDVRLIMFQDRGFTYTGGSNGGFNSNGRSKNMLIVTAYPKTPACCDETTKCKTRWAANTAERAQRFSVMKPTQKLYLLIIVGNGTIVQK